MTVDDRDTSSTSTPPHRTDPIYLHDAYQRVCEATVLDADPATGMVVLDRTIFYPGGGGQPHDAGRLISMDTAGDTVPEWQVTGVRREGGVIRHALEPTDPLPVVGERVRGELDWALRYRLMRTHTALHVLCGVVFHAYGALVTGGNMGPDKARMDFELDDLSPARVSEIEARANAEIAAGREIRVRTLPRAEAFAIPDLLRTKINLLPEGITEVRTVEIVGLDLQADGGTHVANTREVGGLRVVGTRSKGKTNKRLEVVLVDAPESGSPAPAQAG